ncbi:MAG TPA: methylenetetrahydrofolate reductase [Actinomycetota bacterium]|jgi:5,10-methylenetetrahydrofolate reductase
MTIRSGSRLERLLHHGVFCVTAEVVPPRSGNPASVDHQAREVIGYADAVNVTDNPTASAHMSAVAGASLVAESGLEPVVQLTCRDRNRLGLTSDLLGAWALGARAVLCLTGDPPDRGDHPDAPGVFDLTSVDLVGLAAGLRDRGRLPTGAEVPDAPRYFVGVADVPLAQPYSWEAIERKVDAGADFVQTQIVFDVEAFAAWAEQARSRGLLERVFVLAGVAIPRGAATARYLKTHVPGVIVPDDVVRRLDEAGDDAEEAGVRIAVELVARLKGIAGIHGVHLMGLGRTDLVRRVVTGAGLLPRPAVA